MSPRARLTIEAMPPWSFALQFAVLTVVGWTGRRQQRVIDYLLEENRLLRAQLGGRRVRLTGGQRRRLAVRGKLLGRRLLGEVACIVTPDTILRWYRRLVTLKYDGSSRRSARGPGRPRTKVDLAALVVRMATENPRWGYTRIRGGLRGLGHELGRSTIRRILADHGLDPAPERGSRTRWSTFLKAHWGAIAATDFFTVEVLTSSGLVRYFVLFVIKLKTREVHVAGITPSPCGSWMLQVARNLTDAQDGFLNGITHLVLDRDPLYTTAFRSMLGDAGTKPVRLPPRSPNLNAFAERFVLSVKSECLDRVVPLGEAHLRCAIREYVAHYHRERPHQGLDNELVIPDEVPPPVQGVVWRRERLGGLLNHYYRRPA